MEPESIRTIANYDYYDYYMPAANYDYYDYYMPAANYNGSDTFTYKANDGQLDSNIATVAITITPVAKVSGPDSGVRGQPLSFTFTANDAADASLTFTYSIDWGDGLTTTVPGAQATIQEVHVFTAVPSDPTAPYYVVHVAATDQNGIKSAAASQTVAIQAVAL